MPILSEHYEQALVIQFMRRNYPEVLIFAIPNGGQRNAATGARLKAEGVVPGVPDLFIPAWGLFIEMKTLTGKVSLEQKAMLSYAEDYRDKTHPRKKLLQRPIRMSSPTIRILLDPPPSRASRCRP